MAIASRAWGKRFAAAMMLLWLAGCAVTVPESGNGGQTEFLRYGRFALKAEDFNRDPEAVQGGFTWRDAGVRFSLDLTDPMGSVIARIVAERAGATLTRSNGEQVYAKTPDALLQTVLGQTIPVDGLRSWLRTINSPLAGMTMVLKDPEGRIQTFEQSGWRVQLSRFDELGPQLLVLTQSDGSKNIAIRLVVDKP
jgi:outer membrane lipoprotein LolB